MQGKTELNAIAGELGTDIKKATNIHFGSISIPGIGMEPKIIGSATTLENNELSTPLEGNNGVFLVQVTDVKKENNDDVTHEKNRLAQSLYFRASSQAFNAHREKAEIEDQRAKFY